MGLFEKFSESFTALQKKEREIALLQATIKEYTSQVNAELIALEEKGVKEEEHFSELLERAEGVVSELKDKKRLWEQSQRDILSMLEKTPGHEGRTTGKSDQEA